MGPKRKGRGQTAKEESNSQKRNETPPQIMEHARDEVTLMDKIIKKKEADEIHDNMNEDVQRIRDNPRGDYLTGLKVKGKDKSDKDIYQEH